MYLSLGADFVPVEKTDLPRRETLLVHGREPGAAKDLVLFLHGLGGRRYDTWGRFPYLLWKDLPTSDLGLVDYRSGLRRLAGAAGMSLEDRAQEVADALRDSPYERVVLVGHSMGGLLCQEIIATLLRTAARDQTGRPIVERIVGLFLMATPQAGSARIPRLLRRTRDGIVLKPHAQFQTNVQIMLADHLVTDVSASEHPTKRKLPVFVARAQRDHAVDAFSTVLGIPGQQRRHFDRNHRDLVKPLTEQDPVYQWFLDNVRRLLPSTTAPAVAPAPEQAPRVVEADGWKRDAAVNVGPLFGITEAVEELGEQLANADGHWVISVFGPGGAGKTTLAYEAVSEWGARAGFARIAWVSAKFAHLRQDGVVEERERRRMDWRELLVDIAERLRLEIPLNPSVVEDELPRALRKLASDGSACLIVVDNLETVPEAELVLRYIEERDLVRPHKVVLTTRKSAESLSDLVRQRTWNGLDEGSARACVEHLARVRGLDLEPEDVERVVQLGERKPLLLELTVSLATRWRQPVHEIESRIRSREDAIGNSVQSYLYAALLADLRQELGDDVEAKLMSVFCCKASDDSFSDEEFHRLSLIGDREAFLRARSLACDLTLVRALRGNRRFTVHPTLREYICGDRAVAKL
ncbi:alpha/beta fold hydrolase [Streptomyces sp. NPDC051445]|uniref:alpha/beta fold hydrolase n=1 Tax=Streptomyces sp. NPDC051445 TaxID=3365653 RepID=UPI0037B00FF0